jgi:ABC-type hemin transport system ATPase subunit
LAQKSICSQKILLGVIGPKGQGQLVIHKQLPSHLLIDEGKCSYQAIYLHGFRSLGSDKLQASRHVIEQISHLDPGANESPRLGHIHDLTSIDIGSKTMASIMQPRNHRHARYRSYGWQGFPAKTKGV